MRVATYSTNKMPDEFIDILRNKLAVTFLGARTLTGMAPGNIEIPKRDTQVVLHFLEEMMQIQFQKQLVLSQQSALALIH